MEVDMPFCRIRVILSGYFKQILYIVRRANQLTQVRSCIKRSDHSWNLFTYTQYSLTKNMIVEIEKSEEAI